jgi:chromosome partitioning protein
VPRNVRLAEAPSYGQPGTVYDKNSRGAKAYIDFGNELVRRVKKEALLARARIPGLRNA